MNRKIQVLTGGGTTCLILLLLLIIGCSKEKNTASQADRLVPVIIGKASMRRVEYILNQVGTLEASQEVTIRSELDGKVVEILFDEGGDVQKDEILVRMDPTKINAEIRSLEAGINQLKIRFENKNRNLERNRALVQQDLVSQQQFDDLQSEIKEINAQIERARADLARQKDLLSDTIIRAPFDGKAGARNFSVGHYVRMGDSLVDIVSLDPLEISFRAPEKFKARILPALEVLLRTDAYPGQSFKGKVYFVSPQVDVNLRSFHIKARVDNDRYLLNPGMFAHVQVVTEVHENALTVPWESVIQTEDETYIYLVSGDTASKFPIKLGWITEQWAEVIDPPFSMEAAVILEGKFAVKDGVKVSAKNPAPSTVPSPKG